MAVIPLSVSRVSLNLRAQSLLEAVRVNQVGMFRVQNQLATGLRFLQPSDDPRGATRVLTLDGRLDRLNQIERNVQAANAVLTEAESAAQDAVNLMREAQGLALESVGDSSSTDERRTLAVVADSLLDQLRRIGNRKHLDTWLFGGDFGGSQSDSDGPFVVRGGGVLYRGDAGTQETAVESDLTAGAFTLPGSDFFGAVSSQVIGSLDLNPILTLETRLADLRGAGGSGVSLGSIVVSDGVTQSTIDLSATDTVGDVLDRLNNGLPGGVIASLGTSGILIGFSGAGASSVTISDPDGGRTAADLGIAGSFSTLFSSTTGDLDPILRDHTAIPALRGGAGLTLSQSLRITNGALSADLNFAGAQTMQDILSRINQADLGVWARLASDGRRIELINRLSGTDMSVGELGGTLATQLGIRSFRADTTLASLHDGRGVGTVSGPDLRISTRSGASFIVDVDGLTTIQDVINAINGAAGGSVTASLTTTGNGLRLIDNTAGAGTFAVAAVEQSPAVVDLGLDVIAAGGEILGRDVAQVRTDSAFTALMELREGLQNDDRIAITRAAERLERVLQRMQEAQGRLAATAKTMDERQERIEAERAATQILRSDVRDVDVAEAAVRFQQLQTALQANLQTGSRILNLSLLDYLR